jgi:hypothetical protein
MRFTIFSDEQFNKLLETPRRIILRTFGDDLFKYAAVFLDHPVE